MLRSRDQLRLQGKSYISIPCKVSDPHQLNAGPDHGFKILVDPDPGFEIFPYPDPDPGLDFFQKFVFFLCEKGKKDELWILIKMRIWIQGIQR